MAQVRSRDIFDQTSEFMDKFTKQQMIEQLAGEASLPKTLVNSLLDAHARLIQQAIKKGARVSVHGVGTLAVKQNAARKGRNPATGEAIEIEAKKVVKFTASLALREAAAGSR